MKRSLHNLLGAVVVMGVSGAMVVGTAGTVTFTIDPVQSRIALSGKVPVPVLGSYAIQPQGPESLITSYSGTIIAEVTPPSIAFPGGSLVRANTNGIWRPAPGGGSGSAAADYAGQVQPPFTTGYAAVRNLQFDLSSPPLPVTNGSFDMSQVWIAFVTNSSMMGRVDFLVSSLFPAASTNGSVTLVGVATNAAGTAYLTNAAERLTLVLPVNATNTAPVGGEPATLVMQGQVVATAPAAAWPIQVGVRFEAGQVVLRWASLPGQKFTVQARPDFKSAWGMASGTLTPGPSMTTWSAPVAGPARFYRILEE